MTTYEIYLDGLLVSSTELRGIAYLRFESACLLGKASFVRVVETGDPVMDGKWEYNADDGGWDYKGKNLPPCPPDGGDCKYRRFPEELPLQRNALRVEVMAPDNKCGWALKSGRIGGHNSDYHVCRVAA